MAKKPAADTPSPAPRIATVSAAEELIRHFADVMNSLIRIVEKETETVRAGRTSEAAALEPTKAELARLYLADVENIKRNADFLRDNLPESLQVLTRQHDNFYAMLQINLTVLATAHAVAEGIIRGVAEELAKKSAPAIYGHSGRRNAPNVAAPPVAVSRKL